MKPRHKVSATGIDLIKAFEGYRRGAAQLPDGRWTIGYGHSKTARRGAVVSEQDAELLLRFDLIEIAAAVNALTFTPLTQNQFDALASFAFNIGLTDFRRSSVLRRVNEGALLQAACAFEMWRKADFEGERIVVDALVRRRAAEKALFLTPPDGWVPAPSPVLPPRLDLDDGAAVPAREPVDLKASLDGDAARLVRSDGDDIIGFDGFDDAAPSQISEASEALSARLAAIFTGAEADEARAAPHVPPEAEIKSEPVSEAVELAAAESAIEPVVDHSPLFEDVKADTPWPEAGTEIEAKAEPEHEAEFDEEPSPFEDFRPKLVAEDFVRPQPIYREPQPRDEPAFDSMPCPKRNPPPSPAPYLALAFMGFVLFALALSWAFRPHAHSGSFNPMMLGLAVAGFGIGCVAWSVYTLTTRFNGPE